MRAMAPLQEQVRERGLWAAHLPPDLGGQGFGQVKLGLMHEILGTSPFAPVAFGNQAPDSGNSEVLALAGTEDQKEQWLHPLLAGDLRSAFSMTEPDTAGSDPTLLRTSAVRGRRLVGDQRPQVVLHQRLGGRLPDRDGGHRPRGAPLPAGLDVHRAGRHAGRDDRARRRRPWSTRTSATAPTAGTPRSSTRTCACPPDALLGARGAGFLIAQQRLGPGRIHHCMRWLGVSKRAFDMLCERALSRYSHGSLLADKQTVQNWIADSAAEMHAARLMTLHAAWKMDAEGASAARQEIALIKFYGAKVLHDVVDRALQAHGSLGYSTDLPLEQMYRFARAARLYDGPDEVHRQSVARQILRGYVPAAHGGRRAERARADPPRGRPGEVRGPARGGDLQRLRHSRSSRRCSCWWVAAWSWRRSSARSAATTRRRASAALKVDRFDRDRAFEDLRYQVELGPRPAGSETSKQLAEWLRERLPNGRLQRVPGGLQNVIGDIPGRGKPIVVAAHYDTKDLPGFVGANDGAGGTAARAGDRARAEAVAGGRAAAPLRALRRRGEPRRLEGLLLDRPARLQVLRAPVREADAGGDPARLRGREGRHADPARGLVEHRAVGPAARRRAQGRRPVGVPGRDRAARFSTTTRRSCAAGCRRST